MGDDPPTLLFRCPRELHGLLPPPVPATHALPDWLRTMPRQAFSEVVSGDDDTVKRCPPFLDAMTCGFILPLMCDVTVRDGEFSWDNDLPPCEGLAAPRSPMAFHDASQVAGTPLREDDKFLIKFHNLWTIEAPPGYALLFTHPANRLDLPFTTLTGLVDCDRYHDLWIHFPATWRDDSFSGVLPRGTPIAQCVPVRREAWTATTAPFTDDDARRARDLMADIGREKGVYRRRFRA